uniref:Uncharacterized protein n=1 Tax=Anguilla anguilla TaxID=7936 RepID=A0A0E9TVZ5_ANGAN
MFTPQLTLSADTKLACTMSLCAQGQPR